MTRAKEILDRLEEANKDKFSELIKELKSKEMAKTYARDFEFKSDKEAREFLTGIADKIKSINPKTGGDLVDSGFDDWLESYCNKASKKYDVRDPDELRKTVENDLNY